MKDPAFLFYSKDFYEGTRTMLPEERACLLDLMIYQHQNGFIPNDTKRLSMYCSGISEATLQATLEAKFKLGDKGWYNEKLLNVVSERQEFSSKQSDNGVLGQFFKKAKATLKPVEFKQLRDYVYGDYGKEILINDLKKEEATHEAMLEALLKHLAIANAIVIENKDEEGMEEEERKEKKKKEETPTHPLILWIEKNAPDVQKLKEPLTEAQAVAIISEFPDSGKVRNVFLAMHNSMGLTKKYKSANLTFRNWVKNQKSDSSNGVVTERKIKLVQ